MMGTVIPFPHREPPPFDEVLYKQYGVKRERLTEYERRYVARWAGKPGPSYEELLLELWAFGGI
jgi:hypothetical protein